MVNIFKNVGIVSQCIPAHEMVISLTHQCISQPVDNVYDRN